MFPFLFLAITIFTECVSIDFLGPADFTIISVQQCPESHKYPNKIFVNKRKYNRTQDVLDINMTIYSVMPLNPRVRVDIAKWGDGGWKPNFYITDELLCPYLFSFVEVFSEALKAMGHIPPRCPLQKGFFATKNFIVDPKKYPETMLYGEFRAEMYIYYGNLNSTFICLRVFGKATPKRLFAG